MRALQVSNAFGSNIFDILLGLGFPWFLQLAVVDGGSTLYVGKPPRGLTDLGLSLFLLLITLLVWAIGCGYWYRWQLFPTMGYFMCTVFVVWAARQVADDYS